MKPLKFIKTVGKRWTPDRPDKLLPGYILYGEIKNEQLIPSS